MTQLFLRLSAAAVAAHASLAGAATITQSFAFNGLNLAVPDGNPSGMANVQTVSSSILEIQTMTLTLNTGGTFNGDLYAYVTNGQGFAVLLNRPGKTAANPAGYADDGFQVTFDDAAPNGNIHLYQTTVTPGSGLPLTGLWRPDGRNTDPNNVTDLTSPTASLSSFTGQNPNTGSWTLYVADLTGGDAHTLNGWTLTFTGSNVPEPGGVTLTTLAAASFLFRRKRFLA